MSRVEFLSQVDAFNREETAALDYFTARFHLEPNALSILLKWAAPHDPQFVLGYLRWAMAERVEGLFLPKSENWNLTLFFPSELSWCKKLGQLVSEAAAACDFKPTQLVKDLAQGLVKRNLLLYPSDPSLALRNIQHVMPWAKVTLSMCRAADKTGERNIIMPLFANWTNRIQEKHQLPLLQCPEVEKIDLSFAAHITPQDWHTLAEQLPNYLQPSNHYLISALVANNADLADVFLDMGFPRKITDDQEAHDLFRKITWSRITSQQFLRFFRNAKVNNSQLNFQWLTEILLLASRMDLLVMNFKNLTATDIRLIEQRILTEASSGSESWLHMAASSGLIGKILESNDREFTSFFRIEMNRLIRHNGRLARYF